MNHGLYICKNFYICLFKNKEDALSAWQRDEEAAPSLQAISHWRSKKTEIEHINPGDAILVLRKYEHFWEVLYGEKIGWIVGSSIWVERHYETKKG